MRNFKKILALLLALTMVLGLGITAFAADATATVTFNANGGSNAPADGTVTIPDGETSAVYTIPATVPTKGTGADAEGFVGWKSSVNNAIYAPGDKIDVQAAGVTLTAQWKKFTITVDNTLNSNVSIKEKTYTAYKLFDASYVNDDAAAATYPANVVDAAPHAYYMSTTSPFYAGTSYNAETNTWTYGTYTNIIKDYFDFTVLPGDTSKVLVTPKKDAAGDSTFTEDKAYEMAQKLEPNLSSITTDGYVFTADGGEDEKAVINVSAGGAGYYLVTGSGKSADGKDVTAAVALTTTDPTATIKAKVTGNTLDKSIDEGSAPAVEDNPETTADESKPAAEPGNGVKDDSDPKEDTHAVGDTIPYVLTSAVPDMTGYEHYFFVLNDTLSKGLTYNDDLKIVVTFEDADGYVEHLTSTKNADGTYTVVNNGTAYKKADGTFTTTAPTLTEGQTPDDLADQYEVRNHQFVKYTAITDLGFTLKDGKYVKDQSIKIGDTDKDYTVTADKPNTPGETALEVIFKDFFNKVNGLTGADITITYSATINEDAVIGVEGNPNKATLTYSNNPNKNPSGTPGNPDKPGEDDTDITGKTPEQITKTYVTGIKIFKYELKDGKKSPLAGAKFEFIGENLNKLVETDTEYYREADTTKEPAETGTYYLLTDGTYTTTAPTVDTINEKAGDLVKTYTLGTWRKYVQTQWTSAPATETYTLVGEAAETVDLFTETEAAGSNPWKPAYLIDTVKSWALENTTPDVKLTVETDEEGIITITGLNEGWYVLTETEAPDGYNLLNSPYYIHVVPATKDDGSLNVDTDGNLAWSAIAYTKDQIEIATENGKTTYTVKNDETTGKPYAGTPLTADEATSAWLSELEVLNQSGTELPSTGGIGTTIFYIVGGLLAVGAGVVLVSKKRMSKVDD